MTVHTELIEESSNMLLLCMWHAHWATDRAPHSSNRCLSNAARRQGELTTSAALHRCSTLFCDPGSQSRSGRKLGHRKAKA
eukprot:3204760-Alexandrium_andersonii.AAC.1